MQCTVDASIKNLQEIRMSIRRKLCQQSSEIINSYLKESTLENYDSCMSMPYKGKSFWLYDLLFNRKCLNLSLLQLSLI